MPFPSPEAKSAAFGDGAQVPAQRGLCQLRAETSVRGFQVWVIRTPSRRLSRTLAPPSCSLPPSCPKPEATMQSLRQLP